MKWSSSKLVWTSSLFYSLSSSKFKTTLYFFLLLNFAIILESSKWKSTKSAKGSLDLISFGLLPRYFGLFIFGNKYSVSNFNQFSFS